MNRASVVLLAGGAATRLPGKLIMESSGIPLIVRTYRNLASDRTIVLSRAARDAAIDALADRLPIRSIVDEHVGRGPLDGLLGAMRVLETDRVFAIAADMPYVDAALLDRIEAAWDDADEALVPAHDVAGERRIEPLAALYDRRAFLREGSILFDEGRGSITRVIERLQARFIETEDPHFFSNLNTPDDYAALQAQDRLHA